MEKLIKEHPVLASILIIFIALVGVFPPILLILSAGSPLVPEGSFVPLFMLWLAFLGFLILPVLSVINIVALNAMINGKK